LNLDAFLADEGAILNAISHAAKNGFEQQRLIAHGRKVSDEFPALSLDVIRSIVMTVVHRIHIKTEHIEFDVSCRGLDALLAAQSIQASFAAPAPRNHVGDIVRLTLEARLQRVGREMKLVVHDAEHRAEADPGLLRLIARAHDFQERLIQDPDLTVPAIASQERLTIGYLSRLLRLPSLAPDIFTAMINGQHPPQLSAKRLMRLALKLPTD
jgi:site-specific DNA recombinase